MESAKNSSAELIRAMRDDISHGLLYTHIRINDNTKRVLESGSFLYVPIEMLREKGLIAIGDLDERKTSRQSALNAKGRIP